MLIVDKSKLILLKADKLYIVIPLTITKVETKLRNVFINATPKINGLSRFMQFYLESFTMNQESQQVGKTIEKGP